MDRRMPLATTRSLRSDRPRTILRVAVALGGFFLLAASGCAKKATLPELHPVRGKVVFQGGRPVAGGIVVFQPHNAPEVSTSSAIGEDGTFELFSFKAGIRAPGATEGPHRVVVNFADGTRPHYEFSEPFEVRTGPNEFTLTVPANSP